MGNILTAMGAPVAQQAINNTMTEMEERPYREEARTNRMAMDKMTLEKAQIEMKNIKEREAFLEQKVNFGQTLREKGELHENTIQYGEKGFKNLGIIDESGMISRKNLGRAAMEMENQEKVMKNVFKYDLEQRTADMDKAWNKFEKINKEDSGATQQEKIDAKKTYEEAKRLESVAAGRIGKIDKHYETKKEMREILQDLKSDPEFKKLVFSDPTLQGKVQTAIKLNDPTLLRQVVAKAFEQSGKPEKEVTPHWNVVRDDNKIGKTGWVYQDMNNPENVRPNAPAPTSEKDKERTFKDQQIEKMWPTLSEDERKKVLGAGVDPHELTQKNILDVYANIMTSPDVKKAIQPIAERIIKEAAEGKKNKPQVQKVISQLPSNAKFHGYSEDGKKVYVVPPATTGGKSTYIKEQ